MSKEYYSFVLSLLFFVMVGSAKGNANFPIDPKDGAFQSEVKRIELLHGEFISMKDQVRNDWMKKVHKLEEKTKQVLKSLPKMCRPQNSSHVHKPNTAVAVESCNGLDIFEDILVLAVRTTNFTLGLITDGALIVTDYSSCLTHINPFSLISCFYNLSKTVSSEIRVVIENTKYFTASVKELVPDICNGLKTCFAHGLSDYLTKLHSAVKQVVACSNKVELSQE